jgi:hypothetical protein
LDDNGLPLPQALSRLATVPTGPLGPLRQRALGYDMIKAGDPTYPADFAPLYNKVLLAANQPGAFNGPSGQALAMQMQILNSQKRVYDQGLGSLPPAVSRSIVNQPSTAEGQVAPSTRPPMDEPWGYSNPQADDIKRLFQGRVRQNAPTQAGPNQQWSNQLKGLMKLPQFGGFTGGDEV